MSKPEAPRGPGQLDSTQPSADRHCSSDSSSSPAARKLVNQEPIRPGAVVQKKVLTLKQTQSELNDDALWGFKTVIAKTGLSRSSLYGYIARGIFPRQRRLGPRRVAWLASEVRGWINSRPS